MGYLILPRLVLLHPIQGCYTNLLVFVLSLSVSGNLKVYLLVGLIFNEAHVQLRIIIIRHSILKIYMVLI